jgi:hypothetical protein
MEPVMEKETVNTTNSPVPPSTDNQRPDDHYLRMLRFYLDSKRWVEDQISAELEVEIESEFKNLGTRPEDWGW